MQANPLKFIDDLKTKGESYGWAVRIPAAPGGEVLRKQFLTRDYGAHSEALARAVEWRDEMCKRLPLPLHARVSQYLDGTHKAIQPHYRTDKRYPEKGKRLTVRAQWVEFDAEAGEDRIRNVYRNVPRPEDFDAVYAEVAAIALPRIVQEAERIAKLAGPAIPPQGTPVPTAMAQVLARCSELFPGGSIGSMEELAKLLERALTELATRRASGRTKGKGPASTEVDTGPKVAGQRGRGGISPSSAICQTGTR